VNDEPGAVEERATENLDSDFVQIVDSEQTPGTETNLKDKGGKKPNAETKVSISVH
jgi:hypothetical protein